MSLIIEDGSVVDNANSFVSIIEARAFCEARNFDLPNSDSELESLLITASDFLNSKEKQFKGQRVVYNQSLIYPRENVYIFGTLIENNSIPEQLKHAQCQLAYEQFSNEICLLPTLSEAFVSEERIGSITTKYDGYYGSGRIPVLNYVDSLLEVLMKESFVFGIFKTVRV